MITLGNFSHSLLENTSIVLTQTLLSEIMPFSSGDKSKILDKVILILSCQLKHLISHSLL